MCFGSHEHHIHLTRTALTNFLIIRYGHTRVKATDKSDPHYKLCKWVQNQRNHYWMYMKGEKSCINDERIEVLEDLGFEWRVKPGRTPKGKAKQREDTARGDADGAPLLHESSTGETSVEQVETV